MLTDFAPDEAKPLKAGVLGQAAGNGKQDRLAETLLARVLHWTGGHPYLTQRLYRALAEHLAATPDPQSPALPERNPGELVDSLCGRLFLSRQARETDDNLMFVRNSLLRSGSDLAALLDLYSKVRAGRRIAEDETDPLQSALRLAGVVRSSNGVLRSRNRIYDHVFDPAWVRSHMPGAELRRQRTAYLRGLLRALTVGLGVLIVISALALSAAQSARRERAVQVKLSQANRSRQAALAAEQIAQNKGAEARTRLSQSLALEGNRLLERGDPLAALFPLTEALRLDEKDVTPGGRDRVRARRCLIGSTLAEAPGLMQIWTAAAPVTHAEYRGDGRRIVTLAGTNVTVLDPATGAVIAHRAFAHPVTAVHFNPSGTQVAVAGDERAITICAADTLNILRKLPLQHPVFCLDWSHDGRSLALGVRDGCQVIDAVTGRHRYANYVKGALCKEIRFSPDDSQVALAAQSYISVWMPLRSTALTHPLPNTYNASTICFSPDGRSLLTQGDTIDGSPTGARVYDVPECQLKLPVLVTSGIGPARFSPDGSRMVVGDNVGMVRIYDAASGQPVTPSSLAQGAPVVLVAFSPDSHRILSVGTDGSIQVWDAATGERIGPLLHHAGSVRAAMFAPDGWHVLLAGDDRTTRVWDLRRVLESHERALPPARSADLTESLLGGRRILMPVPQELTRRRLDRNVERTRAFDYQVFDSGTGRCLIAPPDTGGVWNMRSASRDGRYLALGSRDCVRVWDVATQQAVGPALYPEGVPEGMWDALALSADGSKILLIQSGRRAEMRDVRSGRLLSILPRYRGAAPQGLALKQGFSPDGRYMVVVYADNTLRCIEAATGRASSVPMPHESALFDSAFSPDGRRLFTVTVRGAVRLWDVASGRLLGMTPAVRSTSLEYELKAYPPVLAFSRDGLHAATCLPEGYGSLLWDLNSLRHVSLPPSGDKDQQAVFSPNGRTLTLCNYNQAFLYDAHTGRSLRAPLLVNSRFCRISPNGASVAAYGDNGQVNVWDVKLGQLTPLKHPQPVAHVEFSPDSRSLATLCADGKIRLWNLDTGELLIGPKSIPGLQKALFLPGTQQLLVIGTEQDRLLPLVPCRHSGTDLHELAVLLSGDVVETHRITAMAGTGPLQATWTAQFCRRRAPQALSGAEAAYWQSRAQLADAQHDQVLSAVAQTARGQLRDAIYRAIDFPQGEHIDWVTLARECIDGRQWDWAASAASHAVEGGQVEGGHRPGDWEPWYLRAIVREHQGRLEEALADLEEIDRRVGRSLPTAIIAPIWQRREKLLVALGRWSEAVDDYRAMLAARCEEHRWCAYWAYRCALLLIKTSRLSEYRQLCEEALKRDKATDDGIVALYVVRTCSLMAGAVRDMTPVLKMARELPVDSGRDSWLGRLPAAADDNHHTLDEDRDGYSVLALALVRAGRPREALRVLQTSTAGRTRTYDEELTLALAQNCLGEQRAAREHLERAQRLLPTYNPDLMPFYARWIWPSLETELWRSEILQGMR